MLQQYLLAILLMLTSAHAVAAPAHISARLAKPSSLPAQPHVLIAALLPVAASARDQYVLDTVIDYDRHLVRVDESITYRNASGQPLDVLVLAVAPNLWSNCFALETLSVNHSQTTEFALQRHRLQIELQTPLAADAILTLELQYTLFLPKISRANSWQAGLFGYTDMQLNLVDWYPFVVPNFRGHWLLDDPAPYGEFLTYPFADYEVNVVFTDRTRAPLVASSGSAQQIGDFTRYMLSGARAFALSASRNFEISSMQVGDVTVSSYYFPVYRKAAAAALQTSAQALQVFSQKFSPYAHTTLAVVIADCGDSRAFSAVFFQCRKYYDLYDGSAKSFLDFIAAHETAQQWWFDQIGSDPSREPWLDESLATYSESVYYEAAHTNLVAYWWANRIDFFQPTGDVNISLDKYTSGRAYKQAVYFNGAQFLADLRARVGDKIFFAFLKDYLSQNRGKIVTAEDFFRALNAHTDANYADILHKYFRMDPQP